MKHKPIDLSVRPPQPHAPLPLFRKQLRVVGSKAATAAGLTVFNPATACTVQWILVQTSAACTLQLLLSGQPFSIVLTVGAGALIRFAGTLLVSNESLAFLPSVNTTLSYEVVWTKELDPSLILDQTAVVYAGAVSGVNSNVNIFDAAGNVLNSNGAGALKVEVVDGGGNIQPAGDVAARAVFVQSAGLQVGLNKNTTIETVTPLAGNATFTGAWHDSQADGTTFVIVSSFSNVVSAASGLSVDLSDDNTNANFTRVGVSAIQAAANTLTSVLAPIRARYWRVTYHNGATIQASLEVTACAMDSFLPIVSGGGTLPASNFAGLPVSNSQGAVSLGADNQVTWITFGGAAQPVDTQYHGGAFAAAADLVRQGYSKARTPTVFRQLSTAATGSTAIWTPGTGNKFRLLRYRIVAGASAIMAAATDLTLKLLDSATDIGQDYIVRIPVAALGSGVNYDSGWVDLGFFGILSAAANNALNASLSAALTGGLINFLVAGTEE